jgi:uncharacterized protein YcaQ
VARTAGKVPSIVSDIAGAQAQVLSAAQLSIWARSKLDGIADVEAAIWKERTLVRAWCMRRTLFLVPSDELSIFVRGSFRRSAYNLQWAMARVSSKQALDKLLDTVMEILDQPRTRNDLAKELKSHGYRLRLRAGGGWGDTRSVPHVDVAGTSFSVGFLLHVIGARDVICSGPRAGNETTFVRADRWLPHWKDTAPEKAEEELLRKYLRSFGPATPADFALWLGLYMRDAREIWQRAADQIVEVEVDGAKASILEEDLQDLEKTEVDGPVVRLLPNFDSFLLGHKSHRNIVDEGNHKRVYRSQGWISPVLLVDGRSAGVWSYVQRKSELEVLVSPFSSLSPGVKSLIKEEASELGRFLSSPSVKTAIEAF